ncbi:hypothetical protein [Scytonema sp. PCC 10023]|uniref:hypothetical protein n=1 Tax=Scytonema sp. PCC 10023 TaxID=1680591 RepID=UPI0039C62EBE
METIKFPFPQSVVEADKTVTVPQGHNLLSITLRDHSWVSVCVGDQETVSEHSPNPVIEFTVPPGSYSLRTDGVIENAVSKSRPPISSLMERLQQTSAFLLQLTSDAPDRHIVDGIGEVPADGTSFCTITIEKSSLSGTPLANQDLQDELFLRTTGGTLMDTTGAERIRSIQLQEGKAAFRLISEPTPKVVTVSVFGREPLLSKAEIQIEFV